MLKNFFAAIAGSMWLIASCAIAQQSAQNTNIEDMMSRHTKARAECATLFSTPSLKPLSGKVPFPEIQDVPTAAMLRINRKPNATELKVLSLYSLFRRLCDAKLSKALYGDSEPLASDLAFREQRQTFMSTLQSGNITFAEYNIMVKEQQDKAEKAYLASEKAEKESQKEIASLLKPFYLTCLFEQPKNFAGFEIQYLIDEANRTIQPNRGPRVESTSISESEFSYVGSNNDGSKTYVTISRMSGRMTFIGGTVIALANCQRATQQRF